MPSEKPSAPLADPADLAGLERLIDHMLARERVWICRRIEVAHHWHARHPPSG